MRKSMLLLFVGTICCSVVAQGGSPQHPQWQVTVQVIGEDGNPVSGAKAYVSYYVPRRPEDPSKGAQESGLTDANGLVTATAISSALIGYGAEKPGYYSTGNLQYEFRDQVGRKWQPWNPTFKVLLKRVGTPIAMYAKLVEKGPPVFNQPVGYDLIAGDWIAPHGRGQTTDIIFTGRLKKNGSNDFDYKLSVSFPKAGDGIQEFSVSQLEAASQLRSPHEAPAEGYQPQVTRIMIRHPGEGTIDDSDRTRNYFFRVRTVLDDKGSVKSALYGKIYGDFMQFRYYLNPTPNSLNVEFDPKHNLLKSPQPFEQVSAP